MSLAKLLENAADRLEEAAARIEQARSKPATTANQAEWLAALTDYTRARADIQAYNNESVHEKLQEIAGRARLGPLGSGGGKTS
jgi:hypothetical protein